MTNTITKIKNCEIKEGSNGKFANLTFTNKDGTTTTTCKIWNDVLINIPANFLRNGNTIDADVIKHPKYGWVINSVKLIKEAPIGLIFKQRDWLFNDLKAWMYIENIQLDTEKEEDEIRLKRMFSKISILLDEYKDVLMTAPASIKNHHNYVGGLLQHTHEVVQFISDKQRDLNSIECMECIAAAIIHDFAKIFEYSIDTTSGLVEYVEEFPKSLGLSKGTKMAAHIYWIHNWCIENGIKELSSLVGSHHSLEEWGAMFKPASPAAEMLFIADYYSSRFGLLSVDDFENTSKIANYSYFSQESKQEELTFEGNPFTQQ